MAAGGDPGVWIFNTISFPQKGVQKVTLTIPRGLGDGSFTLETPEGYCTSYVAGFIFDPSMQESDVWHADVTHLFDLYLEFNGTGEYAPGAYKLNCFIDGSLCNSICWELD